VDALSPPGVVGARWVSRSLRDAYVALLRAQERRLERRRLGHRRMELCRLNPGRPTPLGEDRWGHRFFAFPSDPLPLRVWVDVAKLDPRAAACPPLKTTAVEVVKNEAAAGSSGGAPATTGTSSASADSSGGFNRGSWVASAASVRGLALSLDRRGARERALREALLCHTEAATEQGVRAGTTNTAFYLSALHSNSTGSSSGCGGGRTTPPPPTDY
jgi:hypothetical protein